MKKIDLDLKNCFGIKKLNGKLSFGNGHTVLIYARNGLMKTSLAKKLLNAYKMVKRMKSAMWFIVRRAGRRSWLMGRRLIPVR